MTFLLGCVENSALPGLHDRTSCAFRLHALDILPAAVSSLRPSRVRLSAVQGSGQTLPRSPTAAVEQVYDLTFGSVLACSAVINNTARSSINLN